MNKLDIFRIKFSLSHTQSLNTSREMNFFTNYKENKLENNEFRVTLKTSKPYYRMNEKY
jgi:hypothetical protein